jgi:hypothetical protein
MKVSPRADYPVRVIPQAWEEVASRAGLYEGIFTVTLNHTVDVTFVPDVSAVAPQWDSRFLPASFDEVATVEQARVSTALVASYVVTPNETLAGTQERFVWPPDGGPDAAVVVFYVTSAEFARYAEDLDRLSGIVGSLYPDKTVSDLRDYEVVGFLERRVVASPLLDPGHATMLCRGRDDIGAP